MAAPVQQRLAEWRALSAEVLQRCHADVQEIGAVSVDFLHYSAYVLLASLWLRAAECAQQALDNASDEHAFYQAKLHSTAFYLKRILPRASAHREALLGGAACLLALDAEHFAF